MNETPEYETMDDKVNNIERYLVRQVDTIRRLVVVAITVASVAVVVSVWGIVGQERVISIARTMGETGGTVADATPSKAEAPVDAAPRIPSRSIEMPAAPASAPVTPKTAETTKMPVKTKVSETTKASGKTKMPETTKAPEATKAPPASASAPSLKPDAAREIAPAASTAAPEVGRFAVESSAIATEIVGLSPVGAAHHFPASQAQLFCWSRIVTPDLDAIPPAERVVTHRWTHEGEVVYERRITIGSTSYRVYSMVANPGDRAGSWKVEIVDASGRVIGTEHFVIE